MVNLLAIDVGNTQAKLVRYRASGDRIERVASRSVANDCDWLAELGTEKSLDRIAIGSVVAGVGETILAAASEFPGQIDATNFGPTALGLDVRCDPATSVGVDRVAAVLGAAKTFGSPVITVDFGTAITIDAGSDAVFLGGLILPGPSMMFRAMHDYTSALPLLEWETGDTSPLRLGRSTDAAMQAGVRSLVIHGVAVAAAALRDEVARELECSTGKIRIVRTGGAVVPFGMGEDVLNDAVTRGLAFACLAQP